MIVESKRSTERLKTLIIDDVKAIRLELKFLLEEFPRIEVIGEAASGKDAIEIINKLKPEVIFLDIQLPVISGLQVLEACRGNFKVIIISSFDKYLSEAQKYNIVDFLMKPINKEKLNKAVGLL